VNWSIRDVQAPPLLFCIQRTRRQKGWSSTTATSECSARRPAIDLQVLVFKFTTFLFTLMTGHETDPSSAMYVKTNVGAVLCTISMLRKLVRRTSSVRLVYL
jgi:hypothetical protein